MRIYTSRLKQLRHFSGREIFYIYGLLFLMAMSSSAMVRASGVDLMQPQAMPVEMVSPVAKPVLLPPMPDRAVAATPAANNAQKSLSALDAVQSALTNGLAMRTAVIDLHLQAQRLARVVRAEFTPKLTASAGGQRDISVATGATQSSVQAQAALDLNWRLRTGANIRLGNTLTNNTQSAQQSQSGQGVNLTISQPLLRGAGRVVNEAAQMSAESAFRVAAKALGQSAQTLVVQVLAAYVAVQQAQEAAKQAQVAYVLAQRLHALNVALVGAGRSPRNALLQSESDISAAQLGVAQAQNTQRLAVRTLALAMGSSNLLDGLDLLLSDTFEAEEDGRLPAEQTLAAQALQASFELFSAREAVAQAELALVLANDNLLPSLALTAGSTVSSGNTAGARNRNNSVGLSLEYSFDRAPLQLEKASAQANLDKARNLLLETEQRVRDAAIDALRNLNFARAQHDLARNALGLATQRLDAEVTRQSLGRTSQLELTNAQQALAASNRQLLDAARQVFRSRIELAQINGSLLRKWGVYTLLEGWVDQAAQELHQ
jgi:outer membrane protein TolC